MEIFDIKIPNEVIRILIILVTGFIVNLIARGFIRKIIKINGKNNKATNKRRETILLLLQRLVKYIIVILCFISILNVFNINTSAIITSVASVTIIAGLGLQDVLKDFFVGLSLLVDESFSIGDIVEINKHKGEVIKFSLKSTKLKALTGEVIVIANRQINEVINYSVNKKLLYIDVSTRYEDDVDKIEKVLRSLCKRLSEEMEFVESVVLEEGIQDLSDSSVNYRISTLVNVKDMYKVRRKILEEVKKEFDKSNISIPFPQIEVHKGE